MITKLLSRDEADLDLRNIPPALKGRRTGPAPEPIPLPDPAEIDGEHAARMARSKATLQRHDRLKRLARENYERGLADGRELGYRRGVIEGRDQGEQGGYMQGARMGAVCGLVLGALLAVIIMQIALQGWLS